MFKLACLVYQSLSGNAPRYLADDIHLLSESDRRQLRSWSIRTCIVSRTHNSYGDRSFAATEPRLWNSLFVHCSKNTRQLWSKIKWHVFYGPRCISDEVVLFCWTGWLTWLVSWTRQTARHCHTAASTSLGLSSTPMHRRSTWRWVTCNHSSLCMSKPRPGKRSVNVILVAFFFPDHIALINLSKTLPLFFTAQTNPIKMLGVLFL